MIVGDASVLAIESKITKAYERLSFRAFGYFVIYIGGLCYGVRSDDNTLLACSFDEVERRLERRGHHTAPFADDADASEIAAAFREGVYGNEPSESYFGIPFPQFREIFYSSRIVWAPDGDEAFDDGSYVLHFDIGDRVRVIGFVSTPDGQFDPATLRDVRLAADDYYTILRCWHDAFEQEWMSLPKTGGTE